MTKPVSELPAFVLELFQDTIKVLFETAMRVKDRLAVAGDPITYPVQWDSPRQKAAYFASDGFGKGIPYERTGYHQTSFSVERFPLGTRVFAPHPAGAVVGMPFGWQSRIHRNRYPHLLTVLFEELSKVPSEINNKFSVRSD